MSFGLTQYDVEDLIRYSKNCCEIFVVCKVLAVKSPSAANNMVMQFHKEKLKPYINVSGLSTEAIRWAVVCKACSAWLYDVTRILKHTGLHLCGGVHEHP